MNDVRFLAAHGRGGGFYLDATQSRFRNFDFDNHQAGSCGGTVCFCGTDASGFENCRIDEPVAGYPGGTLYLMNSAHATSAGESIRDARASKSGG